MTYSTIKGPEVLLTFYDKITKNFIPDQKKKKNSLLYLLLLGNKNSEIQITLLPSLEYMLLGVS